MMSLKASCLRRVNRLDCFYTRQASECGSPMQSPSL